MSVWHIIKTASMSKTTTAIMKHGISDVNESETPFGTEFGILIDQPFFMQRR